MVASWSTASARQPENRQLITPKSPSAGQPPAAESHNPYKSLFTPGNLVEAAEQLNAAHASRAALDCTVRVIPADPQVDPKIRVDVAPRDTRHTIKALRPPC
jgi:hypothetical protein